MKNLIRQYRALGWEKKTLWSAGFLALVPILFSLLMQAPVPANAGDKRPPEVDTYIPKGFVLVPIEVQNYEALDSILGHFGMVDLFQAGREGHPEQRLVGRNVRLLRAPQNPTHFAILVPESEVEKNLKFGGPFTVIIKRPEKAGTEFVKEPLSNHRTIVYDGD